MCGIAATALVVGLVGAGTTIYGAVEQAKAQDEQAKSAREIARRNAALKNRTADIHRSRMEVERSRLLSAQSVALSSARAKALRGVQRSSGNALELTLQALAYQTLDLETLEHSFLLQEDAIRRGADLDLFKGDVVYANLRAASDATLTSGIAGGLLQTASAAIGFVQAGGVGELTNAYNAYRTWTAPPRIPTPGLPIGYIGPQFTGNG